uniref:FHA domain-containing protein n=1 Tax=Ascaris lumbricoides TaxID=6252 RepID=A0A0M3IEA6_ASCLU
MSDYASGQFETNRGDGNACFLGCDEILCKSDIAHQGRPPNLPRKHAAIYLRMPNNASMHSKGNG